MLHYTYNADLGVSIDKDSNRNYHFSLPNKIFDYIQAGLPILATRLPEIERIIQNYRIGDFIENHEPKSIAIKINEMLDDDKLKTLRQNTLQANKEMNWENERQKLAAVISSAGRN